MFVDFPLVAAVGLAVIVAVWMLHRLKLLVFSPDLVVCCFWLFYGIQSTAMQEIKIEGLYYPLYLLMLFNMIRRMMGQGPKALQIPQQFTVSYFILFFLVILSLLVGTVDFEFSTAQLIFNYMLGFIVCYQFQSYSRLRQLPRYQILIAIILSVWTVYSSFSSGSTARGGIDVNQNVVAYLICFGIFPIILIILTERPLRIVKKLLTSVFFIGIFYSLILLASRGIFISMFAGLLVILFKTIKSARTAIFLIVLMVIGILILPQLPAVDTLIKRFEGSDMKTLNDRSYIWKKGIQSIENASPVHLLFGQGLRSSEAISAEGVTGITSTHNGYLRMLIEIGIVGLLSFLGIHWVIIKRLVYRKDAIGIVCLATLTYLMVANISGTMTDNFIYWIAYGYCASISFLGPPPLGDESSRAVSVSAG